MTEFQSTISRKAVIEYLANHPDDLKHYEEDIDYIKESTMTVRMILWFIGIIMPILMFAHDCIMGKVSDVIAYIIIGVFFIAMMEILVYVTVRTDVHKCKDRACAAREMMNR